MWIIPKSLHISRFVPDMEGLTSDLDELSAMCEQSLFQRSKPSLARTWSQRWKQASWSPHLFGRILKHSHGNDFAERWTSSLEASLVSPSLQRDTEPEPKTPATSSPSYARGLEFQGLPLFSWRTSRGSCRLNSKGQGGGIEREPQFLSMSFESWSDWAIKQRRECSRRERSAPPIIGGECSSWRSPTASNSGAESGSADESMALDLQVYATPWGEGENSMDGSRRESWSTPTARDWNRVRLNPRWVETLMGLPIGWTMPSCTNPVAVESMSSDSSGMESPPIQQREPSAYCGETWPTPLVYDAENPERLDSFMNRQGRRIKAGKMPFTNLSLPNAVESVNRGGLFEAEAKAEVTSSLEIKESMNK